MRMAELAGTLAENDGIGLIGQADCGRNFLQRQFKPSQ
jgi:hypothetical protein